MKRTELDKNSILLPAELKYLTHDAKVYDSSCSPEARVYFADRDGGYFIKRAPAGSLKKEADMTAFFHTKGLSAEVINYISGRDGFDWLVTSRVSGEDLTHQLYLDDPRRLCDVLATTLRSLHSLDFNGCPVMDRMADYVALAEHNYLKGIFEK